MSKKELLKIQNKDDIERALSELAVRPNMLTLKESHNASVNNEFEWDSDLENYDVAATTQDSENVTLLTNSSKSGKR